VSTRAERNPNLKSPGDYRNDPDGLAELLNKALETGDVRVFARAIGHVARARGMTSVAKATGLSREYLYRALGLAPQRTSSPRFETMLKVLGGLGIQVMVKPKPRSSRKPARPPKRATASKRRHASESR
jgi:probable addiction module antidote protein